MKTTQHLFLPKFITRHALEMEARAGHRPAEGGGLTPCRPLSLAILSASADYAADAPLWRLLCFEATLHATDEAQLFEILEHRPIHFILLDQEHGKSRLLDKIKRIQPDVRFIFLLKDPCPAPLLKLAVRGHIFFSLAYSGDAQQLAQDLLHQLFPRSEHRCAPEGVTVEFRIDKPDAAVWRRPLADISNRGIAWLTDGDDSAGDYLPGTVVRQLRLFHGSELLAGMDCAQVVHLGGCTAMPLRYRVGARFCAAPKHSSVLTQDKLLSTSIDVAAILQRGLQNGGVRLSHPYDTTLVHHGRSNAAHALPGVSFDLHGAWPDDWQAGTLLRGIVEAAGWGYEFLSTILARDEQTLTLRTPSAVKGWNRRYSQRHVPSGRSVLRIEFIEPFSCRRIQGQPYDLSTQGFSVALAEDAGPLPSGTRLGTVLLYGIDQRVIRCSGVVRWAVRGHENGQIRLRCGIGLENLADNDRVRLANALLMDKINGVVSGQGMPAQELFGFFRAADFIYPAKAAALAPTLEEIETTYALLLRNPVSPLLRTLVIRAEDGSVEAHFSLLHAYSQTWMSQHLAAMGLERGKRDIVVRDINFGLAAAILQLEHFQWLRGYYQPQKSSDLLVGTFMRRVMDRSKMAYTLYAYLTSSTRIHSEANDAIEVRPAGPADLGVLESYFSYRGILPELLAEDLTAEQMSLADIGRVYQDYGLTRYRQIVVAERRGRLCGVASMEFSSLGLNLSEATSRCTLHVWEEESEAAVRLAEYARTAYRKRGYPTCTLLVRPEQVAPLVAAGFTHIRDYISYTVAREMIPGLLDYGEKLFGQHG